MKIIHVRKGTETDITQLVDKVTWSGDYKQVARQLNFGILYSSTDKNIPRVNIQLGDLIRLVEGNKEYFQGFVVTKDRQISSDTIQFTCYDGLFYLIKSKGTYNFNNVTPKAITERVARDFNIPLGSMPTGRPVKRIFDGESIYNIIMTAYTLESNRTGKQYLPVMRQGRLSVIEKGKQLARFTLDSSETVTNAQYGESMESSINVVKMYNDEGKYLGEVTISGVPGRLQDVYKGDGGKSAARSLLKGIEQTASVDALGDFDCIVGNAVQVKEPHTGLVGKFFIDNDSHTFENGQHQMKLGLAFSNLMDKQEAGDDPDEIARQEDKKSAKGGGSKLNKFISAAESMIGYSYSQSNRMGARSADCSSLVGRAMKKAGITNNANMTTRSMVNDNRFTKVGKGNLQRGDILWERGHVAIFMGGNKTLEARYSIKKVAYGSLGNRFTTAYRIKGL